MSKDEKSEDLEQLVNPYAPPCLEREEIERLPGSMINCDRMKWFYRSLAGIIYFTPVTSCYIAAKTSRYDVARFIDDNFYTLQITALVLGATCLYVANLYKKKSLDLFGEMVDSEGKQALLESLDGNEIEIEND